MTISEVGSAAALPPPPPLRPAPPHTADDLLLDAVRAGLHTDDPVARLLARWPAPPVRAVATVPARRQAPGHAPLVA